MHTPIFEDLWEGNQEFQEAIALRCGEHCWTFAQFFDQILRAEAGLRRLGVKAGDFVTILSVNTPETIAVFYAIDRIGAVADWVDIKLAPAEVETYLTRSNTRVVLVLEAVFSKVYRNRGASPAEAFVALPLAPYISPPPGKTPLTRTQMRREGVNCLSWTEFLQEPRGDAPNRTRWEEEAVITYTGGTTGPAKGVMLSRRAFHASLRQYTEAETEYGRGGSSLTLLPPFSAFGLCQCIHVPLCLGMTVILAPLFQPDDLGALLLRYRPEQVHGTTSYWRLLLSSPAGQDADFSFLKRPRSGGDAMSLALEKRINAFLAQRGCTTPLVQEYGMSEVCGIVCVSHGDWMREGTVGHPMAGCRILAVDPQTGEEVPCGNIGELLIDSDTVMNGYHTMPEADSQVKKPGPDGRLWIWTKDLGSVEPDGSVVVVGRIKRMISRNGFKIFPSVIEDCLLQNPWVSACAVVAGENERGETVPVACVVADTDGGEPAIESQLQALCKEKLNRYLRPEAYHFLSALPLTERGKLDYRVLEQMVRSSHAE